MKYSSRQDFESFARDVLSLWCVCVCVQLSGAVVSGTNGNEWQQVVVEVRKTMSELEVVRSSCLELCCEGRHTIPMEE